jgi:hypothetical protein
MGNNYLLVSDLHLCDVEYHADGWKAYKRKEYVFDAEFDALVKRFVAGGSGGDCGGGSPALTLILNGDTFDFDLVTSIPEKPPWPVNQLERRRCLNPTAAKSAFKLGLILADHPQFIRTLADFVEAGHRIVCTMGNHDRELHFREVQDAFTSAVGRELASRERPMPADAITYEPWFYHVPGEIYAEHGNQYDYYSSFRYLLFPVVKIRRQESLALPMGNLSNRYLMTRMGFFNPHASDYILNLFHYVAHWLRWYAFSKRSLIGNWFWGSLLVLWELFKQKRRMIRAPAGYAKRMQEAADRVGLPRKTVDRLAKLQPMPITGKFFRMIREFWLDRVALIAFMAGGTVALALVPIPLWIKLMVPLTGFPLIFFIYEWLARGDSIFTIEEQIPKDAAMVAEILKPRFVVFGHTHRPCMIPLSNTASYINTGTWAPIWQDEDRSRLVPGLRNYALLKFRDGGGPPGVEFGAW